MHIYIVFFFGVQTFGSFVHVGSPHVADGLRSPFRGIEKNEPFPIDGLWFAFFSSPTCDDLERSPFDGTFSQSKLINRGVPPIDYPISA
jgi:hypothetical protein